MITTITLNPAIDCIIKVKKLQPGTLNRAVEEAVFPGGKGVNVSLVLSELGMDTCCCGFLAGATGKAYEAMLEERGLKQQFQFVIHFYSHAQSFPETAGTHRHNHKLLKIQGIGRMTSSI